MHHCNGTKYPRQGVNPNHTWLAGGWGIAPETLPVKNKGGK